MKKGLIFSIALVVIAAIVYYLFFNKKEEPAAHKQKPVPLAISQNPEPFNIAYIQSNMVDKTPNIKQVQVKGEKAIIQFDESTGYSLIAQLGQSTVIAWQCVNFATEDEVMKAAQSFDIASIKKLMGEQ